MPRPGTAAEARRLLTAFGRAPAPLGGPGFWFYKTPRKFDHDPAATLPDPWWSAWARLAAAEPDPDAIPAARCVALAARAWRGLDAAARRRAGVGLWVGFAKEP